MKKLCVTSRRNQASPRGGSHQLAARRLSSARSAEAIICLQRGGGHLLAARRQSSARRAETVIGLPRGGSHRLAARRQSSARRAEAVIGSQLGGWASASMLLARLCVLWDDRHGSSRPAGPGDALTRTELTISAGI